MLDMTSGGVNGPHLMWQVRDRRSARKLSPGAVPSAPGAMNAVSTRYGLTRACLESCWYRGD